MESPFILLAQIAVVLVSGLIVGGWTFIWLTWMFRGDVRAWLIAALAPTRWLAGVPRSEVASFSPTKLERWLATSSSVPAFFCNLAHCHYCSSAHVAGAGTIVTLLFGWSHPLTFFVIWPLGAAIGIILYEHTYRQRAAPPNQRVSAD